MPDFLEVCKIAKFTKAVSRMVVASEWLGRGSNELLLNGYKVSVMGKESALETWCTTLFTMNNTALYTEESRLPQ